MNARAQAQTLLVLLVLAGVGVGGWFLGAQLLAGDGGQADAVVIAPEPQPNPALLLGRSGLSPFGHANGLPGRQLLVGRVVSVTDEGIELETPNGNATISVGQTTFLLGLGDANPGSVRPGAAVAFLVEGGGADPLIATGGIVLQEEDRPVIDPGPPPGQAPAEESVEG